MRTALLIRCASSEAEKIRTEAERQRRTISAYVLGIAARAVELEDRLYVKTRHSESDQIVSRKALIEPGPRTAILVRCEDAEAQRIREAARRRDVPINAFVLQSLRRARHVPTMPPSIEPSNVPVV
jgi:hypothetical protein